MTEEVEEKELIQAQNSNLSVNNPENSLKKLEELKFMMDYDNHDNVEIF